MNGMGQNFDDFMIDQGLYDEAQELATKKLIAFELKAEMEAQKLTKSAVAKKLHTSRVAVDNILNPSYNTSIGTLERVAAILGKRLSIPSNSKYQNFMLKREYGRGSIQKAE